MLRIRSFNGDLSNETLHSNCQTWRTDLPILKMQKTVKTCFQNLKLYLITNDCGANYAMCVCCSEMS